MDKDFELHCNIFHSLKVLKIFAKANRVISGEGQNNVLNEYSTVHCYVSNMWSIHINYKQLNHKSRCSSCYNYL